VSTQLNLHDMMKSNQNADDQEKSEKN